MKLKNGFTLIEISVALAVLSILAIAAVPVVKTEQQRVKENELKVALMQIRHAIDEFKRAGDEGKIARAADASGYPASLDDLTKGYPILDAAKPAKLYFLRRLPKDPFAHKDLGQETPSKTWGLRSYASPADKPEAGVDVFDVYSKSNRIGRNGLEYSKW
jgi:general secretion pathway protein G